MSGFLEGLDRDEAMLMPKCLDEHVREDNPVRVDDAFVGMLDLTELGFETVLEATG